MSWNYDVSKARIEAYVAGLGQIEIEKLKREADLESLLSETKCREIYSAHVYVTVSNFPRLASENTETERYRRLIQALHVYQREVNRIVEDSSGVNGLSVHFQGQKLHAMLYRPIDNPRVLATRAVVLQLILRDFVREVFNSAFPNFDNFSVAGGADIGDVIATKNGTKGDRELLFLGNPANHAAKLIVGNGILRITDRVYAELPTILQDICVSIGDGAKYRLEALTAEELDTLLDDLREESASLGMTWDRAASEERVENDKRNTPLKSIEYSGASELIDIDALSVFNNKRVDAASMFADVSGFTAYIECAETAESKRAALRVFHTIRREMSCVIRDDHPGVRVQYQGDRVQGLYHLPSGNISGVVDDAVTAGAAIQSSLTIVQEVLPEAAGLSMAVGVDHGVTLVTKLGSRGQRDRICIGEAVDGAATCEEVAAGGEIAITKPVYDALSEELQGLFAHDDDRHVYIATRATADRVARARRGTGAEKAGTARYIRTGSEGTLVGSEASSGARAIPNDKPHATTCLD